MMINFVYCYLIKLSYMKKLKKSICVIALILFTRININAQQAIISIQDGPNMLSPHMANINTTLPDGKVLIMGGRDYDFVSSSKAEIYDPVLNSFSQLGMNYTHDASFLIKLNNGKYLIPGGSDNLGVAPGFNTTETFDPTDNSFTALASMNYGRMMCNGVQLTGGKVLIAGGWYDASSATYGDLYDVSANTFTVTGALNTPRSYPVMLPTDDGGAVLFGGYYYYSGTNYEQVEYYNSLSNSFSVLAAQPLASETGWYTHAALLNNDMNTYKLNNGKYLLFFYKSIPDSTSFALITFDPQTKIFEKLSLNKNINTKDYWIYSLVLDKSNGIVYLPAIKYNTNPYELAFFAVDLNTSTVYTPGNSAPIDAGLTPASSAFTLVNNSKILMNGFSSLTDGSINFGATVTTKLLSATLTLSVSDYDKQAFDIYPNPVKNSINVTVPDYQTLDFTICNLQGQVLQNHKISKGTSNIDLSNISKGLYILKAVNKDGISVRKLIKE